MNIIEAIKKAQEEQNAIRRKDWAESRAGIIPTNSPFLGMFVIKENGKKGTRFWNPSARDLLAEDWEIF